jgi:DNA-directed RNA polymerase
MMCPCLLACLQADIDFASVHDCFWTQAGSVSRMNSILREQFVKMHAAPSFTSPATAASGQARLIETQTQTETERQTQTRDTNASASGAGAGAVFKLLEGLRLEVQDRYGHHLVPTRGQARHVQRQRRLKHPGAFREEDWRPLAVPPLPLHVLLGQREGEEGGGGTDRLLDLTAVLNSTYFFQ